MPERAGRTAAAGLVHRRLFILWRKTLTAAEDDSLERVQSKIAYLERAIVELSDAVFRQHRDIQSIEAQLKAIRDRMAGTPSDELRTLEQEQPPHY
jgi:SlyX protein